MYKKYLIVLYVLAYSTYNFSSKVTITIWVHGTYPALKLLTHSYSPFRSWVYVPYGLSLAKQLPDSYYFRQLAEACNAINCDDYSLDHFYTYGWYSSKIQPKQRQSEGEKLCKSVCSLIEKYKKKYDHISIRFVGFSHGGNVILHCLQHFPIYLDVATEVILLATPIQESNRAIVNSALAVHKIYSFYSKADWMQRIDIQKLHSDAPKNVPFWSSRTFKDSDRVIQICLKVNGKYIGHGRYRSIAKFLPEIMHEIYEKVDPQKDRDHIILDFKI